MFYLKRNVPNWERAARLVVAAILAVVASMGALDMPAWAGWPIAAALALTAIVGFCPACAMVGRRRIGE